MTILIGIGLILLATLCWTLIVLGIYFFGYSRHDSSGDAGLGFMLMAVLPWIAPYLLFLHLRAKWRTPKPQPFVEFSSQPAVDPQGHCLTCGEEFLRDATDTADSATHYYCSSKCAEASRINWVDGLPGGLPMCAQGPRWRPYNLCGSTTSNCTVDDSRVTCKNCLEVLRKNKEE